MTDYLKGYEALIERMTGMKLPEAVAVAPVKRTRAKK